MDFGHLTLKRGTNPSDSGRDSLSLKEAKVITIRFDFLYHIFYLLKDIEEAREKSYTQFKLKLEDIQLIYAHQSNNKE